MAYVGRFAPSPTGRLHLGSLTTAVASYLEARKRGGRWLLRIEDVDTARTVAGAADDMLRTLSGLGFEWDGPVLYQSHRTGAYQSALSQLRAQGQIYECSCTRRQLAESDTEGGYPGTCRNGAHGAPPFALRFRLDDTRSLRIDDSLQGARTFNLGVMGDPIVRRRDGLCAYQLAVVVDDADAGVTDVVRGADLQGSSAWQRSLQQALGFEATRYTHLPLVTDANGKLSKSGFAVPLDDGQAGIWLHAALKLLHQQPPDDLRASGPAEVWAWARQNWRLQALHGVDRLPAIWPQAPSPDKP